MATYNNSLCCYCRLWSLFVSPHLKNLFVESERLCQRLNIILLCTFRSDEFSIVTKHGRNQVPVLQIYIACTLRRLGHDNVEWRRLSTAVAREWRWIERLSCKGSRTYEILQNSKNKRHDTWNIIFILFKSSWNIALTGVSFQSCSKQWCAFLAANLA